MLQGKFQILEVDFVLFLDKKNMISQQLQLKHVSKKIVWSSSTCIYVFKD